MATLLGGRTCADPRDFAIECQRLQLPTDLWLGRAGMFTLPAGREPGRGSVLLTRADLDALGATTDHTLTFVGTTAAHTVALSRVTIVGYECASPGGADDPNATFLVELADRRYHLRRQHFPDGYRAYNVAQPSGLEFQTATLNSGSPWTWAEVLADLSGRLGIGTVSVPFTPDGNPENLIFSRGKSVWDALNDVLARLACVLCYDPTDDTFSTFQLGLDPDDPLKALEASRDYLGRTWDGYSGEFARAWRPEKVRVLFPRRPQPAVTGGESPWAAVDVTLPTAPGVVPDTVVELTDDRTARGATGAPANMANLTARAQERADDWLRQRERVNRPLVRAWRDVQPLAVRAVGQSASRVVFDDRGEDLQTWALSVTAADLEAWRPLADYPPWWPFTAEGDDGGGTAGGCGWAAGLTADDCLEARVLGASGACDCDDTDDTPVKLISSNGSSWAQDNEGESSDCTACATGEVPTGVSVTMSPGAGAFASAPTSWFLFATDPNNPCAQIQQQGDWVLSLDFTQGAIQGFLSNLATSDTAFYQGAEAPGCCGALPTMTLGGGTEGAPEITAGTVACSETPPDPEPEPGSALIICGVPYGVIFTKGDCNGPCLSLKAPGNSGGVYVGVRESCGENSATFAFGGAMCPGARCGGPSRNVVRVRVSWVQCLWDGPAWYCAKDCETGASKVVELPEGAQFDPTITIFSGPYPDKAAGEAVCGVSITPGATCELATYIQAGVVYRMRTQRGGMWIKTGPDPETMAITMTQTPEQAAIAGGDNLFHHNIPMNIYPFAAYCGDLGTGSFRSGPIGPYADPIEPTNPYYVHFLPLDDEVNESEFTFKFEDYYDPEGP